MVTGAPSSTLVTADQAARFRDDGVTVLRAALDERELDDLRRGVEVNLAEPGPWASDYTPADGGGRFFGDYVNWERIAAFRSIALDSALPVAAAALMGSRTVRFFHEHVLVKEPGTNEITPWHHDQPYYCVDGRQNVSMWIALDRVPARAGVRFLAGSHRWPRQFVPRRFVDADAYAAPGGEFELVPDVDAALAAGDDPAITTDRVIAFDVEPGDVIAFSFRILHDAPGTAGLMDTRRRAVSMRYLGDDAVFALRPWLHSPPFDPAALTVGEPLDDPRFPLIEWPAGG